MSVCGKWKSIYDFFLSSKTFVLQRCRIEYSKITLNYIAMNFSLLNIFFQNVIMLIIFVEDTIRLTHLENILTRLHQTQSLITLRKLVCIKTFQNPLFCLKQQYLTRYDHICVDLPFNTNKQTNYLKRVYSQCWKYSFSERALNAPDVNKNCRTCQIHSFVFIFNVFYMYLHVKCA